MTLRVRQAEVADRIGDVLDILADPSASIDDKAAAYAIGYAIQRAMNRGLGVRQKGPTAQGEILRHMVEQKLDALGPLYIGWQSFDVEYPCNAADNWTDASVQDGMAAIRANPDTRDYIREIPAHLEIDVAALGADVHAGSVTAKALWDELRARRWRTDGGKRAVLKVREVKEAA